MAASASRLNSAPGSPYRPALVKDAGELYHCVAHPLTRREGESNHRTSPVSRGLMEIREQGNENVYGAGQLPYALCQLAPRSLCEVRRRRSPTCAIKRQWYTLDLSVLLFPRPDSRCRFPAAEGGTLHSIQCGNSQDTTRVSETDRNRHGAQPVH
ncbi:hypothetical protein CC78DRAFT_532062 [Lojkania enalia]|uniref:Uncharacterized protein n=1 Tax=Lojkania enalia TaxID=147567 RepID=A0A9P4KB17_9PLEO|nr:hypothetical protein CC78DRAFT_532062 [Didymosphaeria enalia]